MSEQIERSLRELHSAVAREERRAYNRLRGKLFGVAEEISGTVEQQTALKRRIGEILKIVEQDQSGERFQYFIHTCLALGLEDDTLHPRTENH